MKIQSMLPFFAFNEELKYISFLSLIFNVEFLINLILIVFLFNFIKLLLHFNKIIIKTLQNLLIAILLAFQQALYTFYLSIN